MDPDVLRLVFVGDLAFIGEFALEPRVDALGVLEAVRGADLIVGNLESPLTSCESGIPGKCTLRGAPGWSRVLARAGLHAVSLANNHVMDYGWEGLRQTMEALDAAGVRHGGAGNDLAAASSPLLFEVHGRRIALLCRSAVEVSAPVFAREGTAGVARFELGETLSAVRACRATADVVVVYLHWGLEDYAYPMPEQRRTARLLVEGGADLVVGHHPHVLQGCEVVGRGLVAYSIGNFLFDDIAWKCQIPGGGEIERSITLTDDNRRGAVLTFTSTPGGSWRCEPVLTRISRGAGVVRATDATALRHWEKRSRGLRRPWYGVFWKLYSLKREWDLRLAKRYGLGNVLRNLRRLRPRHLGELVRALRKSGRIVGQKSTNPYE